MEPELPVSADDAVPDERREPTQRADAPGLRSVAGATMQSRAAPGTDTVLVFEGGRQVDRVTPTVAEALGLTLIDLRASWVPRVLAPDPELGEHGVQPYLSTYERLADEQFGDDPTFDRARKDRYLELYGIFPTMRVHRARLGDEARHRCHDAVEDEALARMTSNVLPWGDTAARKARARIYRASRSALAEAREAQHVATNDALRLTRDLRKARELEERLAPEVAPIVALQAHLRCEGFLSSRVEDGVFDGPTVTALRVYQRRHMIVSIGKLDTATRTTLLTDSRELDFRSLLRALRERVVDATGLLEDGSAPGVAYRVLGRNLEPTPFQTLVVAPAIADGAPDRIGPATERAATALGFVDPASALAALERFGDDPSSLPVVAVALPPPPAYHSAAMDLRIEIDRGDVWYENPYVGGVRRRAQRVERRPTLVVYARVHGRDLALARYGTTIGGWQKERTATGGVRLAFKNSDVGARVIRDVVSSPAWLPPPSTPDDELIRLDPRDGPKPKLDTLGPSYASAYGLAMMIHLRVAPNPEGGTPYLYDHGIREHGSANYNSILRGESHGCHRLFNHLSLRLTSFVLAHREHVRRGSIAAQFARRLHGHGQSFLIRVNTRGYFHELTPPLPVEVLEGRILGRVRRPPDGAGGGHRVGGVGDAADASDGVDVDVDE